VLFGCLVFLSSTNLAAFKLPANVVADVYIQSNLCGYGSFLFPF